VGAKGGKKLLCPRFNIASSFTCLLVDIKQLVVETPIEVFQIHVASVLWEKTVLGTWKE
jgi:hypothetical protein